MTYKDVNATAPPSPAVFEADVRRLAAVADEARTVGMDSPAKALYGGTKEAVLLLETGEELARVPWWAGDDAVEEGDPVTVQGRRYRVSAWGGRCVGRPAYVFVEPASSSEEPASTAATPDPGSGEEGW